MRQVFQDLKTGETRLAEVPRPSVGPGQVLNATLRSFIVIPNNAFPGEPVEEAILVRVRAPGDAVLNSTKSPSRIANMDISVTYFKQHCLKIIRRLEKTGATIAITRRGRVVAQLRPPSPPAIPKARPWERLRALGGCLLAEPGESVVHDRDFGALR